VSVCVCACVRACVCVCVSGWNELLIALLAFQSTATSDCIVLARGLHVYRSNAHQLNFGLIFDRILAELVYKMRELVMDRTELGCLRAIVLFNPGRLHCVVLLSVNCTDVTAASVRVL